MAEDEPFTNIVVDTRFDSYKSFYDHSWARSVGILCDQLKLREPTLDLTRDWKGIAVATQMPWLMIESLKSFGDGFMKTNPTFTTRFVNALCDLLTRETKFTRMQTRGLLSTLNTQRAKIEAVMKQNQSLLDREALWTEYQGVTEFPLALWNAQRIAYAGVYYAYENFIQRVVAAGKNDENYRAKNPAILFADLKLIFGNDIALHSLRSEPIDTARIVRNCLTHDGGRVSSGLRAKNHRLDVTGDEIQIMPDDVRALFNELKARVTKLAEAAARMPSYAR